LRKINVQRFGIQVTIAFLHKIAGLIVVKYIAPRGAVSGVAVEV
jgi:hypothetical protein